MIGNTAKLQKKWPIVTADPLELSSRIIDTGESDEATNRLTHKLVEVDHKMALVESFSHVVSFKTDEGLVCFDASGPRSGAKVVDELRGWSTDPINTLVYTHGHIDHVGGSGAFAADATHQGNDLNVIGHEAVVPRFERYQMTNAWNTSINRRQFGGISTAAGLSVGDVDDFLPADAVWPTTQYQDDLNLSIGGLDIELHHDRGETDDHTWAWIPEHKALCVGDFVIWVFPNCGNPQKVQRYPKEWAAALRKMQAKNADLLFGAHGLPVRGAERINTVLGDMADALESLLLRTVEMMNGGYSLDAILQEISVPDDMLMKPWMRPVYDEPEFVVRNIWRLYGGWWDQNPANLKPSPQAAIGAEMASLAGGADVLANRALELVEAGDLRLACHLAEMAAAAEPESRNVVAARAQVYQARRDSEFSLMSKGIFAAAANESKAVLEGDPDD